MSVACLREFYTAARLWRQWLQMSVTEVTMQYRRSILGPFWLVLNTLIFIATLGVVYSYVFNISVANYLPFLATGLVIWGLLAAFVTEGGTTFTAHAAMVRNLNLPLPFFAYKVASRQAIVFAHVLFALIPVYLFFPASLSPVMVLAVPALALHLVNGVALAVLLGMLCCRFRDLANVIANFMQAMFFLTPIFWPVGSVSHPLIYLANPFYHYVEIVRAPLLGEPATALNWLVAGGLSALLWGSAMAVFVRFRWRVVHAV
jgi:ABC-2 type transport system permease protein/lipopolysaccharide transport system permease protein